MERDTNSDRAFTTEELREAGASDAFISLYLSAMDSGAKIELNSGYGGTVLSEGDDPTEVAGGWFTKMWNGELFRALCHADTKNARALSELFDRKDFVENGVYAEGEPREYVERMVDDRLQVEA